MVTIKAKVQGNKHLQLSERQRKEADVAEAKYAFNNIYDYVANEMYPVHADTVYEYGLRKRSKFFM